MESLRRELDGFFVSAKGVYWVVFKSRFRWFVLLVLATSVVQRIANMFTVNTVGLIVVTTIFFAIFACYAAAPRSAWTIFFGVAGDVEPWSGRPLRFPVWQRIAFAAFALFFAWIVVDALLFLPDAWKADQFLRSLR